MTTFLVVFAFLAGCSLIAGLVVGCLVMLWFAVRRMVSGE